jgi:actin-related protein 8
LWIPKDYSVVLVIPDFYERTYVKDLIDILLVKMGFKQVCVQQASFVHLLPHFISRT